LWDVPDVPARRSPQEAAEHIAFLEKRVQLLEERLAAGEATLTRIFNSHGWSLLRTYYDWRDRLLPASSRRRRVTQALFQAALRLSRQGRRLFDNPYARWIKRNEPGPAELWQQRAARFRQGSRISIVVATHGVPKTGPLTAMLRSVLEQTYGNWELCVGEGSQSRAVRALLEAYGRRDPRIKPRFLPADEGFSGNAAAALDLAGGEFVTFLEPDATLAPFALFEVVRAVEGDAEVDVLYSDEDTITARGRRAEPRFKPDWSPDALRGQNYVGHLAVFRRELLDKVGGPRAGLDGAHDYDLVLRATEQARKVVHVAKVLYHAPRHARSAAATGPAIEAGRKALLEHLERSAVPGTVERGAVPGTYHVSYAPPRSPLVSVLIPTRDHAGMLRRCLDSVARSTYERYEILLVENNSEEPETFRYYEELEAWPRLHMVYWRQPFNYAAVMNYAAAQAGGEVLLLLNNDVEVINPDWMERLLEQALRPEVGGVGAKLYYPNDTVQHGGVVLGIHGVAAHVHTGFPRKAPGYGNRLVTVQNLSAVTAACFMLRKSVFDEVGGFDEEFPLQFNDTDLCLRIGRQGYRIVWTPLAELYHHESKTRGYDVTPAALLRSWREADRFLTKWGDWLANGDPYYNPNLTVKTTDFSFRDG
jgi:GT2 family glycosyltransferase